MLCLFVVYLFISGLVGEQMRAFESIKQGGSKRFLFSSPKSTGADKKLRKMQKLKGLNLTKVPAFSRDDK